MATTTNSYKLGIKDFENLGGSITWNCGSAMSYKWKSSNTLNLYYTLTDFDGNTHKIDYNILIVEVGSNLNNGSIKFFLCPHTNKRVKYLYRAFGCHHWTSRHFYKSRGLNIFYNSQLHSKNFYHNERFFEVEEQLEELYSQVTKSHYKGKPTKLLQRIERLEEKINYLGDMRFYGVLLKYV